MTEVSPSSYRAPRCLRDERTGAGIAVPGDWLDRAGEATAGPFALAASQRRDGVAPDRCVASVNLVAERCLDSIADRSAATLADQSARLPGYVLLDLEEVSLAGRPAARSLFTYQLDGFQVVVDQWLMVERGWAWYLSGGTDTIGFAKDATVLEAIAATLELTDAGAGDEIDPSRSADAGQTPEANPTSRRGRWSARRATCWLWPMKRLASRSP